MNMYIGNLSYNVRESDLRDVMEEFGTVDSVKIIKDLDTDVADRHVLIVEDIIDSGRTAQALQEGLKVLHLSKCRKIPKHKTQSEI